MGRRRQTGREGGEDKEGRGPWVRVMPWRKGAPAGGRGWEREGEGHPCSYGKSGGLGRTVTSEGWEKKGTDGSFVFLLKNFQPS